MHGLLKLLTGKGYRSFFLLAPIWAILTGITWELWLFVHATGGMMELPGPAMPPHLWHGHEMIFGYGGAAVAGFLLTSPLTSSPVGTRARVAGGAVALWGAGRLAIWASGGLPAGVVACVDMAFFVLLALGQGLGLRKRPNPQQAVFLGFLTALTLGNLLVHLDWIGVTPGTAGDGLRVGLVALISLIIVIGGRVTPGFIRNALRRALGDDVRVPPDTPRLDRLVIPLALVLPWLAAWPRLGSAVALALALTHGARLARWNILATRREPLLWALPLAQIMTVAGLVLWALAAWKIGSQVAALHILGIGAVGGMTLAVMSRATLAMSGQALKAPTPVGWAYGIMALAAISRWLGSSGPMNWYFPMMLLAGAAWLIAFTLFLAGMIEALTTPRPPRPAPPPPPPLPPEMKSPRS